MMKITQSPTKTMQITDWLGTDDKMCVDITNKKYFLQWAIRLPIKDVLYRQITVKEVACYKAGIKGEKEYE